MWKIKRTVKPYWTIKSLFFAYFVGLSTFYSHRQSSRTSLWGYFIDLTALNVDDVFVQFGLLKITTINGKIHFPHFCKDTQLWNQVKTNKFSPSRSELYPFHHYSTNLPTQDSSIHTSAIVWLASLLSPGLSFAGRLWCLVYAVACITRDCPYTALGYVCWCVHVVQRTQSLVLSCRLAWLWTFCRWMKCCEFPTRGSQFLVLIWKQKKIK